MARITIEDCIEKVPNRFHLVQMTAIRAKQLKKGARPMLEAEENKAVVQALREVAAGFVKPDYPGDEARAAAAAAAESEEATAAAAADLLAEVAADPAPSAPAEEPAAEAAAEEPDPS